MRRLVFAVGVGSVMVALASCAGSSGSTVATERGPSCELKGESANCGSGSIAEADNPTRALDAEPAQAAEVSTPIPVSDQNGSSDQDDASAVAEAPTESTEASYETASDDAASGGCVWQGRSYEPGDSIRSATDGSIFSADLEINGENFEDLSGEAGPWQGCDCGSSSGTWGCV